MKIAIAAVSEDKNSDISGRGGRAPFYQIYEDKKLIEVIKNPFAQGGGGAGTSVAKMLADKNVNKVIAGSIGPNMASALDQYKIEQQEISGTIEDYENN